VLLPVLHMSTSGAILAPKRVVQASLDHIESSSNSNTKSSNSNNNSNSNILNSGSTNAMPRSASVQHAVKASNREPLETVSNPSQAVNLTLNAGTTCCTCDGAGAPRYVGPCATAAAAAANWGTVAIV
jgi:hypothetical protein